MLAKLAWGYLKKNGEYEGEYEGNRVTCRQCKFSEIKPELSYSRNKCKELGVDVGVHNNVCNKFQHSITHPNYKEFNYDAYFEWLMNDYYRPFKVTDDVAYYIDRPSWYISDKRHKIPVHKTVYIPRCTVSIPNASIHIGKYNFVIDYKKFKDGSFIDEEGNITYKTFYYKEKPRSKKYTSEYDGAVNVKELNKEG